MTYVCKIHGCEIDVDQWPLTDRIEVSECPECVYAYESKIKQLEEEKREAIAERDEIIDKRNRYRGTVAAIKPLIERLKREIDDA